MAAQAAAHRFHLVVVWGTVFLAAVVSVQGTVQLSCSPGWALYGDHCYKVYATRLSWQGALDVCRIDGAQLAEIGDIYTNDRLGALASSSSVTDFWIGLNRISIPSSNTTYSQWSDGSASSVYQAFWDQLQPDLDGGDCVHVLESEGQYRWAFGTCEWKRAFVCGVAACPSDTFQCATGRCVQSSRTCDGVQDCSDGSDEINCPSQCKEYIRGGGGDILSANYPGGYPINSDCQWTLEGPVGSNIFLEVNSLDTEAGKDELIIMGGGKTASTSYNLARLSGVTAPTSLLRSYNHLMIVRFYSDSAVQGTGFNLTWSAVQYGLPDEGKEVMASDYEKQLKVPTFPAPYLTNQESVWVIRSALERSVITLQRVDMDLAPGDYVHVRDGSDASAPLLAEYIGTAGPLYVLSTGPALYILMKTARNTDVHNRGFAFNYLSGCRMVLSENTGEIFSPGYGVARYANSVSCLYLIHTDPPLRTTLRFDPRYDVEYQNDKLQVFVGLDDSGMAMHSEADGGYTGTVAPAPVKANGGNLYVRFQTNAVDNASGWKAVYSKSCPMVTFTAETICSPSCNLFDYGDELNVTCPLGYVFDSLEFYTERNGSRDSMDVVRMECLFGGLWNVQRFPQCVRRYCGQAPQIENGYVQSTTGAVFESVATYVCADDYAPNGALNITCQADGTWQSPPSCEAPMCPPLGSSGSSIPGGIGELAERNGTEAGSVYRYQCDSGYTLTGSPILHCNISGQWSHKPPTCQKVQCLVPSLPNGQVLAGGRSYVDFDTTLALLCDEPAYKLVGNPTIRCLANQTFTSLPVCQDVDECSSGTPCPANTQCTNTDGNYTCPCLPGFQDSGSGAVCVDIKECKVNNGGCSDTCKEVEGSYTCECPEGHSLFTQNGTMGYLIPESETGLRFGDTYYVNHTCVRNQCPTPAAVPNRYRADKRTRYNYGDKVTFSCLHGYLLSGQATLECQANGTWSAELPTCEVAKCPPDTVPQNLVNGPVSVTPSGEVDFEANVAILCNVSGKGVFTKTRTCRFDPKDQVYRLQGDSYECGVVDCGTPLLPVGGLALPSPVATTFGSTFNLTCDYMYDLEGFNSGRTNVITCAADSTWTFFNITCIKRQCPHPGVPVGGSVTFEGNGFDYYDNATFSCQRSGFEPEIQTVRCGVSENGQSLTWGKPTPACVDVEPPTFLDCPPGPFNVSRYSPAGFTVPTASDNSGSVRSVIVTPRYFYPTQPVAQDVMVNYTVVDHAGLSAECLVSVVILDTTALLLECPGEQIITLKQNQQGGNGGIFNPSSVNVTYNSSDADLSFEPSAPFNFSYDDVGTVSVVTVTATSRAGTTATCQYQVAVKADMCQPDVLSSRNTQRQCSQTGTGGYTCSFTCLSGFYFYDAYLTEIFTTTCEPGQPWSQSYIPSCVESGPVEFNMVMEMQYVANPAQSLTDQCQEDYNSSLLTVLRNSANPLKQICSGQTAITDVTYNEGSLVSTYFNDTQRLKQEFSVLFKSQGPSQAVELQYIQCFANIQKELASIPTGTGQLVAWRQLQPNGCPLVSVSGEQQVGPSATRLRTCSVSDYKLREVNGFTVCLPCPPGTSKNNAGACQLCGLSQYWVSVAAPEYGRCVECSRGRSTGGEGSIGEQSCIDPCDGNFVSDTGVPPCRECTGNSFALNSTFCQPCPTNTLALRKEKPLTADCNTKSCTYSRVAGRQNTGQTVAAYGGMSVAKCEESCNILETLPFTSSVCVGFNYETNLNLCFLYDQSAQLVSNANYDYYQRRCVERDQTECFCAPACSAGYYSATGYQPDCLPCPVGFFSPTAAATYCQECPAGQTTLSQASTSCVDGDTFVCQNNPCQNNGACSVVLHDAFCTCQPGYTGRYCEEPVNFCASSPCYNNGSCSYTSQGFTCVCLSGFRGDRCEENINDCAPDSCNKRGTCIDGVNRFTCDCVDNYEGDRCERQVQDGCSTFPCGGNSTCRPVNDYHRQCDCFPGFTGPLCDTEINECEPEPCLNGGKCVDKVDGFECQCHPNFTGQRCQNPAKHCITTSCGVSDDCIDDPVTGLPMCICRIGYTQGEICQYSFRTLTRVDQGTVLEVQNNSSRPTDCRPLCDARGGQCQAFVFDPVGQTCSLYSLVSSTTSDPAAKSVSLKSCSYPSEDYFYTEWFNTVDGATTGTDRENYNYIQSLGMTVCEDTDPIGVECRQVGTLGPIPVRATCDLSGLTCNYSNGTSCPDLEIRFQCARSRVFEGKICSVRDICSEGNGCINSTCINDPSDPKGYRCDLCPPGYTGDLCQLTTDECTAQPCQNNGTCIDGVQTYTCDCPTGFEGDRCERNPDDCVGNLCDTVGTLRCDDGLGDHTCVCRPGYTGANCSEDINDCLSKPCDHGAECVDQVNGYRCECLPGWTGSNCETVLDLCATTTCFFGNNCTTLFNDYVCRCPEGIFGSRCENNPSILLCSNNNPCVDTSDCAVNGTRAVCNCDADKTGKGCELYIDTSCGASGFVCQNGGACPDQSSRTSCVCPSGYSGQYCEVNTNDCGPSTCSAAATCVDGVNRASCRCPLGKALPDCTADIDEDYDMCFSPSLKAAGAAMPYPVSVSELEGLTLMVWVRFQQSGGTGTFLTVYTTGATSQRTDVIRLDDSGLYVNLFGIQTLSHDLFPINDGLWHLVVVFWNSAAGTLDLTVDYLRQDKIYVYGERQNLTANLWVVLGGMRDAPQPPSGSTTSSFEGCVSGVNILGRALDFTTDLPNLQKFPSSYSGDVLRWAGFEEYGNTRYVRPSDARLVNCVTNPSEPLCIGQTRSTAAPAVTFCPEDITVDTIYSDAFAKWTEPTFTGGPLSVSSSHSSGALFQRGSTAVVYVAENQDGNVAVCSFSVFVGEATCPNLDPPRGGGAENCTGRVDHFSACSVTCPAADSVLVEDVPAYYTCGPSGSWATLQDQDGLYPTCGRTVGPARSDVNLELLYHITTGQCSTITLGITTRVREKLATMLQFWGGQICQASDCSDVTPRVDCSDLGNTRVTIPLTNVSAVLKSGNEERTVKDLWLAYVLDRDLLKLDDIIPGARLEDKVYSVDVTYTCEEGQVLRGQMCVECGPGTFYNSSTKQCDNCPVGQFMPGYAALSCNDCPGGQTTASVGSARSSDCAEICPVGQFFNGSSCAPCPVSFYQNQTGQFQCKPCPRGFLTLTEGTTSEDSCAEGCQSGYELLANGTCIPCREGTYRQYGSDQLCRPCPSAYTTPSAASVSSDNCTVLKCPAGSRANASVTGCELCPVGQFQPLPNQLQCQNCSVNFITAQSGSQLASDCQQFCPSGYEVVSGQCVACPVATYKDNLKDPLSACKSCPAGYLTAGNTSTSRSDCSIRNCTAGFFIQSGDNGVKTCAQCPQDEFNPLPYQPSCRPCSNGTGTRQPGADSEGLCEAFCEDGQELVNDTCTPCPRGFYKNNTDDRFGQCSMCPPDFITAGNGTASQAECSIRNCSAGYFLEESNNTCIACPENSYQPDKWATSCIACPPERLTEIVGATSKDQCLLSCSPGRQDQNGTCEPCPLGFFKNRTGAVPCHACPLGFRTAGVGSLDEADCSVAACQPGTYLNATGNKCEPCPYGEYQPGLWADSCLPCPLSNTTTFVEGASLSSQCVPDCPAGLELNVSSEACQPCERGYYRDKSSPTQTTCVLCSPDFITPSTGAASPSDCNVVNCTLPGRYLDVGANQCKECPEGTFNSEWWAESCQSCPTGFTTKTSGLASNDSCYRDCPSGQQVDENTNMCSPCSQGTFRNRSLSWTCQLCPSPLTSPGPGATSADDCTVPTCGAGSFYEAARSACSPCSPGTYQPQSGSRSCLSCGTSRTTLSSGGTSQSDCIARCATSENNCSSDAQCSVDNSGSLRCACKSNYWGNGYTCTHVCDLADSHCLNGASCFKGRVNPCLCSQYYSGPRCETRADPSKSTSDTEIIIGTVIGVLALLLLLILIIIGILVRRRRAQPPPLSDKDESLSTSNNSQSKTPSGIVPRINTQSYVGGGLGNRDPAYYNSSEADREVPFLAYDNVTYQ
ncbi:uncharacterized protein LOC143287751 [Babylonia areolata]|uniref:uncharacterized protein LOC143287751 n=1 Tax=Babylonia areolata TaxID=304850 RepID=UPI003FD41CB2